MRVRLNFGEVRSIYKPFLPALHSLENKLDWRRDLKKRT